MTGGKVQFTKNVFDINRMIASEAVFQHKIFERAKMNFGIIWVSLIPYKAVYTYRVKLMAPSGIQQNWKLLILPTDGSRRFVVDAHLKRAILSESHATR